MPLIRLSGNPFWSGDGPDENTFVQVTEPFGIDADTAKSCLAALMRNETADTEVPENCDLRRLADSLPAFTVELLD